MYAIVEPSEALAISLGNLQISAVGKQQKYLVRDAFITVNQRHA